MSGTYYLDGNDLTAQYYAVGLVQKNNITKLRFSKQKRLIAKKVLESITDFEELKIFYQCFVAWCGGMSITIENGMCLLADTLSGCQTLILGYKRGIMMLHTEEDFDDVKLRLTEPHTFVFNQDGRELTAFSYNNLMPGAGVFGWGEGVAVAVDALFLKEELPLVKNSQKLMLANIAAWQAWYMLGMGGSIEEIVVMLKKLGIFADGYTLNILKEQEASAISFAINQLYKEKLESAPKKCLARVNLLPANSPARLLRYQLPRREIEDYNDFIARIKRLEELALIFRRALNKTNTKKELNEFVSRLLEDIYGVYSSDFVNEWMGGVCLAINDKQLGTVVSIKLRPDIF